MAGAKCQINNNSARHVEEQESAQKIAVSTSKYQSMNTTIPKQQKQPQK